MSHQWRINAALAVNDSILNNLFTRRGVVASQSIKPDNFSDVLRFNKFESLIKSERLRTWRRRDGDWMFTIEIWPQRYILECRNHLQTYCRIEHKDFNKFVTHLNIEGLILIPPLG